MVTVDYNKRFSKSIRKLPNNLKSRVKKLILKIIKNPSIGKPMRYQRKTTREVTYPHLGLHMLLMKRKLYS